MICCEHVCFSLWSLMQNILFFLRLTWTISQAVLQISIVTCSAGIMMPVVMMKSCHGAVFVTAMRCWDAMVVTMTCIVEDVTGKTYFALVSGRQWEHQLPWVWPIWEKIGSLINQTDNRNKVTNLHIWQWKAVVLHALHVQCSFLYVFQKFLFFPQSKMNCFAVVWTTLADDDKLWNLSLISEALVPIFFRTVRTHFASILTLKNWEMIAETGN